LRAAGESAYTFSVMSGLPKTRHRSRLAACCLIAAGTALGAISVGAVSARAQDPPKDAGAETFNAVCSKCHTPERILASRRTKSQWEEILDKMAKIGAPITDENYDALMDYLLRRYGLINVNRGDSKDIAMVVNLSQQDADAIVKYRTDHGNFADFDALAKVPGIDVKKLEENRAAISF
jgi:competence protein ComEA